MKSSKGSNHQRGRGSEHAAGDRSNSESSSGDEEWEVENGVASGHMRRSGELNGESVREGMERWRGVQVGRTVAFGVGWVVSVVGLWGDRFVVGA